MRSEELFVIRDPEGRYTIPEIEALLEMAQAQGHPLEANSYLEHLTVRQLDNLVHRVHDA